MVFLKRTDLVGGNMKLYMIKYIDLYMGRHKTGFLYTSSNNVEYEFRRNYIGDITIERVEEIKTPMGIYDVGEVYAIL